MPAESSVRATENPRGSTRLRDMLERSLPWQHSYGGPCCRHQGTHSLLATVVVQHYAII